MRRGSSAHWMTFLSRTSHTGSYAARSIGPSDLSMLRTRSKKPVDPSQTANGGAACAYTHKKCRSGSVAKFIRARSRRPRRQNLPPHPVLAPFQRNVSPPLRLLVVPAAVRTLHPALCKSCVFPQQAVIQLFQRFHSHCLHLPHVDSIHRPHKLPVSQIFLRPCRPALHVLHDLLAGHFPDV